MNGWADDRGAADVGGNSREYCSKRGRPQTSGYTQASTALVLVRSLLFLSELPVEMKSGLEDDERRLDETNSGGSSS
jgi:hypothetical protein